MKLSFLLIAIQLLQITAALSQNYKWARRFGGSNTDYVHDILVDSVSNVFIVGSFSGTINLSTTGFNTHTSVSMKDGYFAKYDSTGIRIWSKQIGGLFDEEIMEIELDPNGDIILAGIMNNTTDFDPNSGVANLSAYGGNDIFLAKYDNTGNLIWAFNIGDLQQNSVNDLVVDDYGNIYIGGHYQASVDFDPGPDTAVLTSQGYHDIYFAKYDNDGNFLWVNRMGDKDVDICRAITLDSYENLYVTGTFRYVVDFDPGIGISALSALDTLWNGVAYDDIFLAKYDSSGNFLWAQGAGAAGWDIPAGVEMDSSENVVIAGFFEETVDFDMDTGTFNLISPWRHPFIAKYDSSGGLIFAKQLGNTGSGTVGDLTLDSEDNIVITGSCTSGIDFDPGVDSAIHISLGASDMFIAKYDPNCNYLWAHGLGSVGTDYGADVEVTRSDDIIFSGRFGDDMDADPGPGIAMLSNNSGGYDIMFAKFGACNTTAQINIGALTGCVGDSLDFLNSSTGALSSQWWENGVYAGDFTDYARKFDSSGTYNIRLVASEGSCTDTSEITMTIYGVDSLYISQTICSGDSVLLGGAFQKVAGIYMDTLANMNGCDSIITTSLSTFYEVVNNAVTICNGDSILLEGAFQQNAATYYDTLNFVTGCDTVIVTTLALQSYNTTVNVYMCIGDSMLLEGSYQTSGGAFKDTLASVMGCDSVILSLLTVYPVFDVNQSQVICSNDSMYLQGTWQNTSGVYYDSLLTVTGCDSFVTTNLLVNVANIMSDPDIVICSGESVLIYNVQQTTAGTYSDAYSTSDGCDSIYSTVLVVKPDYAINFGDTTICEGDSAMILGSYRSVQGTYYDSLNASNGCDSVLSTVLTVSTIPIVNISGLDTLYCVENALTATMIGSPAGGIFSGTGVTGSAFDPVVAGIGTHTITYTYSDGIGCVGTMIQTVTVESCPGFTEYRSEDLGLALFPNPNTGVFEIIILNAKAKEEYRGELRIFNILGELIHGQNLLSKKTKIDISDQPAGVYFLQISLGENTFSKMIVCH